MPISTDTAKFSIDFTYEWEIGNGDVLSFPMKFLHSSYGPTLQITCENGVLEFPADMFVEVCQFLVSQGAIKTASPVKTTASHAMPQIMPIIKSKATSSSKNPLIPQSVESTPNIQDQPPPVDIDPEEIVKNRLDAKARASAARRGKISAKHKDE